MLPLFRISLSSRREVGRFLLLTSIGKPTVGQIIWPILVILVILVYICLRNWILFWLIG
ncbi:hypothetical protein LINPERPRIM_LOCUS5344 [Linum perenne]